MLVPRVVLSPLRNEALISFRLNWQVPGLDLATEMKRDLRRWKSIRFTSV